MSRYGRTRCREIPHGEPMTDADVYAIERWMDRIEFHWKRSDGTVKDHGAVSVAFRHTRTLIAELRRQQREHDALVAELRRTGRFNGQGQEATDPTPPAPGEGEAPKPEQRATAHQEGRAVRKRGRSPTEGA